MPEDFLDRFAYSELPGYVSEGKLIFNPQQNVCYLIYLMSEFSIFISLPLFHFILLAEHFQDAIH